MKSHLSFGVESKLGLQIIQDTTAYPFTALIATRALNFTFLAQNKCLHGQLKSRWLDRVECDMSKMVYRNWKALTQKQDNWRKIVEEAKYIERTVEPE